MLEHVSPFIQKISNTSPQNYLPNLFGILALLNLKIRSQNKYYIIMPSMPIILYYYQCNRDYSVLNLCYTLQFTRNRNVRFAGCDRLYPDDDKRLATPLHRLLYGHYCIFYYGLGKTRISIKNPIANKSRTSSVFHSHKVADKIHGSICKNDECKCEFVFCNLYLVNKKTNCI